MAFTTPVTVDPGDAILASLWNEQVRDNLNELAPFFSAWTLYTPVLTASTTNPTLGAGSSAEGRYLKVGRLVVYRFKIAFGTSGVNAGSGFYKVSAPVNRNTAFSAVCTSTIYGNDVSVGTRNHGFANFSGDNAFEIFYLNGVAYSATTPWTWAASDTIEGQLVYEAAAA